MIILFIPDLLYLRNLRNLRALIFYPCSYLICGICERIIFIALDRKSTLS